MIARAKYVLLYVTMPAIGILLLLPFMMKGTKTVVAIHSHLDLYDFKGTSVQLLMRQLGSPTRLDSTPSTTDEIQYRYDYVDQEHVVFFFVRKGVVADVSLVKKSEWPGWVGHGMQQEE